MYRSDTRLVTERCTHRDCRRGRGIPCIEYRQFLNAESGPNDSAASAAGMCVPRPELLAGWRSHHRAMDRPN